MLAFAVDWVTLSSLATALGTLVLAVATFSSVRSASRSTRISEIALQEQRRPVLTASRLDDSRQKMLFADRHWVATDGGRASAECVRGTVYLAISLRNVGSGMAVCQGWTVVPTVIGARSAVHAPLDQFRAQAIDIYIPGGDIGMWQGALRDPDDPMRAVLAEAIDNGEPISVELLYSDLVGAQRTISRFGLQPAPSDSSADRTWYLNLSRHWHLDNQGPRSQEVAAQVSAEIVSHLQGAQAADSEDPVE